MGARLREEHRHAPSAEDWVRLLGDWLLHHVAESDDAADTEVLAVVKAALPSVGYQWTRRGVRRGRSPLDRVRAPADAKPPAGAAGSPNTRNFSARKRDPAGTAA